MGGLCIRHILKRILILLNKIIVYFDAGLNTKGNSQVRFNIKRWNFISKQGPSQ